MTAHTTSGPTNADELKLAVDAILRTLNAQQVDYRTGILACANTIGCILASLECTCGDVAAARVQEIFPAIIQGHMVHAMAHAPVNPPPRGHRH